MILEYIICYGGEMLRFIELFLEALGILSVLFCLFGVVGIWMDGKKKQRRAQYKNRNFNNYR